VAAKIFEKRDVCNAYDTGLRAKFLGRTSYRFKVIDAGNSKIMYR